MPYNKGDFTQQGVNGDVSALVRLNEKRVMKVVLSSDDESDNCDISGKVYDLLNGADYNIGSEASGNIDINTNGVHDVSAYTTATVQVPDTLADAVISKDFTGITSITTNATDIRNACFENGTSIVSINAPNALKIREKAFKGCTALTTVNLPECTEITFSDSSSAGSQFQNCSALTTINIPKVTKINGYNTFSGCSSLTELILPAVTQIYQGQAAFQNMTSMTRFIASHLTSSIGSAAGIFTGDTALELIDLGKSAPPSGTTPFANCSALATIILRNTSKSTTNSGIYGDTQFGAGGTGGTVYVPSSLLSSYQSDSTWAAIMALNANNQFKALEGSPYEQLDWYEV